MGRWGSGKPRSRGPRRASRGPRPPSGPRPPRPSSIRASADCRDRNCVSGAGRSSRTSPARSSPLPTVASGLGVASHIYGVPTGSESRVQSVVGVGPSAWSRRVCRPPPRVTRSRARSVPSVAWCPGFGRLERGRARWPPGASSWSSQSRRRVSHPARATYCGRWPRATNRPTRASLPRCHVPRFDTLGPSFAD